MLGGNKHKPAPALKKAHVVDKALQAEIPRPLFRGFIGGDAFITKKGFRGLKLESLWVQNIFEAFKNDDGELATIALQSPLADVNDRVCGGIAGAPFSIGDFGFYAQTQFEPQLVFLRDKIRMMSEQAKLYLSNSEWEDVEKRLIVLANHGTAAFQRTAVGDSFAALAIRQSAFQVAKVCMNAGIDPLVENSEQKDMFDVMKEQYRNLSAYLKEIQDLKEEAQRRVMVPSAVEHILSEEGKLLDNIHFLSEFSDDLRTNLETRIANIATDKILQRRAALRNESFPDEKLWNISQLDKAERYLLEIIDLKNYIVEKIHFHEIHAGAFQSLSTLLLNNARLVAQRQADEVSLSEARSLQSSLVTGSESYTAGSSSQRSRRQGSVMSRSSAGLGLDGRMQRDPSVLSLKGGDDDDNESAISGALRAGFLFDDASLLTEGEEGGNGMLPSKVPKLPHIPNRLRNSVIDGRAATNKMRARTRKSKVGAMEAGPEVRYAALRESLSPGGSQTSLSASVSVSASASPSRAASVAHLQPLRSLGSPGSLGTTRPSSSTSLGTPFLQEGRASSSRMGFDDFSSPPQSASSSRLNVGDPSTPSQKIRAGQSAKHAPTLSSTDELYAALGVADTLDADSIGTQSRGGKSGGVAQQDAVPVTSAKLLARSLKQQYAPVLGKLKETENAVIMYR